VSEFVTDKLRALTVYSPHIVQILNRHYPRSAQAPNAFTLNVPLEVICYSLTKVSRR